LSFGAARPPSESDLPTRLKEQLGRDLLTEVFQGGGLHAFPIFYGPLPLKPTEECDDRM
jgi:hypothetical protein